MTLFTSDTDINPGSIAKTAFLYLLISVFCALFGAVYEIYSHEVYSFYMIYAFAFPLILGAVPFSVLKLCSVKKLPCFWARNLYHGGIAALTIGSIIHGVLEIYGTTNELTSCYRIVGILMVMLGLILYFAQLVLDER